MRGREGALGTARSASTCPKSVRPRSPSRELAELVQRVVGYEGEVVWDGGKPDGTPRKLLDVGRLEGLGWRARVGIEEGGAATYRWYGEVAEAERR